MSRLEDAALAYKLSLEQAAREVGANAEASYATRMIVLECEASLKEEQGRAAHEPESPEELFPEGNT